MNKKRLTGLVRLFFCAGFFAINAVILFFLAELCSRPEYPLMGRSFNTIEYQKLTFVGTCLLFMILSCLGTSLFGKASRGIFFSNFLITALALCNRYKLEFRNEYLEALDFLEIREAAGVMGKLHFNVPPSVIVCLVILLVVMPLAASAFGRVVRKWGRPILSVVFAAMFAVCGVSFVRYQKSKDLVDMWYAFNSQGFIGGLALSVELPEQTPPPENYSMETVAAVLEQGQEKQREIPVEKPDILFIMCESFFDTAACFDDVTFSQDPLAVFRELQAENWGGNKVMVKAYGGNTASTEYEVLTGYRMENNARRAYVMPGVLREGMLSVPSLLNKQGYYTQAVHPNDRNFYRRSRAYRNLGFAQMDFKDTLTETTDRVNGIPTDHYLFGEIRRLYEERPADQPWFCHVVTFQNHSGYDFPPRWNDIRVTSGVEPELAQQMENHANGIYQTSLELRSLLEYFSQQERPTLIVIWGDHSPTQGIFGLDSSKMLNETGEIYITPVCIWNNYGLDIGEGPEHISAYRLGAFALSLAGIDADPYYNYLASDAAPNLYMIQGLMDVDGQAVKDDEAYDSAVEVYNMLEYDRKDGMHYGEALAK